MPDPYFNHAIERIGENLHLIVLFIAGLIVVVRNYAKNPHVGKPAVFGFLLLLISVFAGGFRQAWLDLYARPITNSIEFAPLLKFNLLGVVWFLSTLCGWIGLIFSLSRALKSPHESPAA